MKMRRFKSNFNVGVILGCMIFFVTGEMNSELSSENNFPGNFERVTTDNEELTLEKQRHDDENTKYQQDTKDEVESQVKVIDTRLHHNDPQKRIGLDYNNDDFVDQNKHKKLNESEFTEMLFSMSTTRGPPHVDEIDYNEAEFPGEEMEKETHESDPIEGDEINSNSVQSDTLHNDTTDGWIINIDDKNNNNNNETENDIFKDDHHHATSLPSQSGSSTSPSNELIDTIIDKNDDNITSENSDVSENSKKSNCSEKNHLTTTTTKDTLKLKFLPQPSSYVIVVLNIPWSKICTNEVQFRCTMAAQLSTITARLIQPNHVVLLGSDDRWPHHLGQLGGASGLCEIRAKNNHDDDDVNPVTIMAYVDSGSGQADQRLTVTLGKALLRHDIKLMDTIFHNVILEVHFSPQDEVRKDDQQATVRDFNNNVGVIAAFTISAIAGTTLILLCILLLIVRHRHQKYQREKKCRPMFDTYSLDSISIYSSVRRKRNSISKHSYLNLSFTDPCTPSHQINFAGLANLCIEHDTAMEEEFKSIPNAKSKIRDLPPETEPKNCFIPETRVKLQLKKGETNYAGFMDANYIRDYKDKSNGYIACQGPTCSNVNDFWRMIWEQQSKVIVMLTQFEENGVSQCVVYLPTSELDCHQLYGDYQITLKKKEILKNYVISSLQIRNLEKNLVRDVTHFLYTGWPIIDNDFAGILALLLEARPLSTNSGPITIHCGNGIGRTGTCIVIDICMRNFEKTRTVDIPNCVYLVRQQRAGAVETVEQYTMIYKTLNEYASRLSSQNY